MNPFISRLIEEQTPFEFATIQESLALLENLRNETAELTSEEWLAGMGRMAPFRLRSSGSLSRGEVTSWQKANAYVAEKIQEGRSPTWEDILAINAIIRQVSASEIRNVPIFLGPSQACPVEHLNESLQVFEEQVLNLANHRHPVIAAALIQYVFISIHPFLDGNGRTSHLLADWILNLHGYLPMSFESKLDALVASLSEQRASATPANAILKLIKNVRFSYEMILSPLSSGQSEIEHRLINLRISCYSFFETQSGFAGPSYTYKNRSRFCRSQ